MNFSEVIDDPFGSKYLKVLDNTTNDTYIVNTQQRADIYLWKNNQAEYLPEFFSVID